MAALSADAILAGCDEQQRAVITADGRPLVVVAGAGSGKTRVLTRRIAWQVQQAAATPEHCLALTFTRKAAHELRTRLRSLGLSSPVPSGTFHSVALAELRRRFLDTGRQLPVVVDQKLRLLDRVVPRDRGGFRRQQLAEVGAEIEWAKARRITPDLYETEAARAGRRRAVDRGFVAETFAAYETEKRRRGVLDLDDLLERLTLELEADIDFAAATRWRFRHLFVDELQDANPAQLGLLDAWLGESVDLFAVGDARQAIYGWNGADPNAIEHFVAAHPGTTVLSLTTNYRSAPAIVTVAAALIGDETTSVGRNDSSPTPTVTEHPDDKVEAASVTGALGAARTAGRSWSSCAVLARTNALLVPIADACRRAGVPLAADARGSLLASPTVDRLLSPIARSRDPARFRAWRDGLERRAAASAAVAETAFDDEGELLGFVREFAGSETAPTGAGLFGFLREMGPRDSTHLRDGGVDLLTFHRAKGLEWDSVWVIALEDGYVPISRASTEAELSEERRLLYVALTRAREHLCCSWASTREIGSRVIERDRSPLLEPIATAIASLPQCVDDPHEAARVGLRASRAALGRRTTG